MLASRALYKWQQACSPRPVLLLGWQVVQFCYKWLVVDTLLLPSFQACLWPSPSAWWPCVEPVCAVAMLRAMLSAILMRHRLFPGRLLATLSPYANEQAQPCPCPGPLQALKWGKIARMGGSTYATGWAVTLLILLASWAFLPARGRRGREKEAAPGKNGAEGV